MLGKIFSVLVIISFIFGMFCGTMDNVCNAALQGAQRAITVSISLMGSICLWNAIASVLFHAGFVKLLSKVLHPVLKTLFPQSCKSNNGILEICAAFGANFLGLGNAALPMGIKAMKKLSTHPLSNKTAASNEMVLFAVINTVPFQLIPSTLIALRNTFGSPTPSEIILPIWICSVLTICFAVLITKSMERLFK